MKTMSIYSSKEAMLNDILSTMDIPKCRRNIDNISNLMWMTRNLAIRNRDNEDFEKAMTIIKEIIREKW